jgi:hypothetical protein
MREAPSSHGVSLSLTYHDAAALAKLAVDRLPDQRSLEIMWESEQSLTGVLLRVR